MNGTCLSRKCVAFLSIVLIMKSSKKVNTNNRMIALSQSFSLLRVCEIVSETSLSDGLHRALNHLPPHIDDDVITLTLSHGSPQFLNEPV